MQDLTAQVFKGDPLTALAPTSQEGGNMMASNELAQTAPGSTPFSPLPPAKQQADPKLNASGGPAVVKGGKDHHPGTDYHPGPPAWKNTH